MTKFYAVLNTQRGRFTPKIAAGAGQLYSANFYSTKEAAVARAEELARSGPHVAVLFEATQTFEVHPTPVLVDCVDVERE